MNTSVGYGGSRHTGRAASFAQQKVAVASLDNSIYWKRFGTSQAPYPTETPTLLRLFTAFDGKRSAGASPRPTGFPFAKQATNTSSDLFDSLSRKTHLPLKGKALKAQKPPLRTAFG